MELKQWHGFCLCPLGGACPPDAVPADAPFSPLVFLVRRDPLRSRGLFAVTVLDEVFEAETAGVLLPPAQGTTPAEPLREFVAANGACVLNTAFSAAFSVLERWHRKRTQPLRVTLVGLGDVGGTLLLALKLLGRELGELRIYDPNAAQCRRYELELNQVLPLDHPLPPVTVCTEDTLFDCDLLLFTASRGVPARRLRRGGRAAGAIRKKPRHAAQLCSHGARSALHRSVLPDLRSRRPAGLRRVP